MRTSVGQVPSLNRVASQVAVHVNIYTDVVCAVGHDLPLFCADSHSICCCSVYETVGEV